MRNTVTGIVDIRFLVRVPARNISIIRALNSTIAVRELEVSSLCGFDSMCTCVYYSRVTEYYDVGNRDARRA